jgi:uncharacterized membrane protein
VLLTLIYQLIVLLFCVVLVWELVEEKRFANQLTVVIVLVPMVLRLLMIK